jgi:proteasome lid subunit RPN8/RPN11
MVAIFHSHPSSAAYPSHTDVNLAFYEDAVYVIVSLVERTPVVKGFSIREGKIEEVEITVQ